MAPKSKAPKVLKDCKPGEVRNPETGRCVKIGGETYKKLVERGVLREKKKTRGPKKGAGQANANADDAKRKALALVTRHTLKLGPDVHNRLALVNKDLAAATKGDSNRRALAAFKVRQMYWQLFPKVARANEAYQKALDETKPRTYLGDIIEIEEWQEFTGVFDDAMYKNEILSVVGRLVELSVIVARQPELAPKILGMVARMNGLMERQDAFAERVTTLFQDVKALFPRLKMLGVQSDDDPIDLNYCADMLRMLEDPSQIAYNGKTKYDALVALLNETSQNGRTKSVVVDNYAYLVKAVASSPIDLRDRAQELLQVIRDVIALEDELHDLGKYYGQYNVFDPEMYSITTMRFVQDPDGLKFVSEHMKKLMIRVKYVAGKVIKHPAPSEDVVAKRLALYDALNDVINSEVGHIFYNLSMEWPDVISHMKSMLKKLQSECGGGNTASTNTLIRSKFAEISCRKEPAECSALWNALVGLARNCPADNETAKLVLAADRSTLEDIKEQWMLPESFYEDYYNA